MHRSRYSRKVTHLSDDAHKAIESMADSKSISVLHFSEEGKQNKGLAGPSRGER